MPKEKEKPIIAIKNLEYGEYFSYKERNYIITKKQDKRNYVRAEILGLKAFDYFKPETLVYREE